MSSIGVTIDVHTDGYPIDQVLALVRTIEELGYDSVWMSDAMGRDPFLLASHLLANTRVLKVGTAVANMYGRDAMSASQARRDLSELYPDRFLMGLGVSVPFMNDLRGAVTLPPVQKQADYLGALSGYHLTPPQPPRLAPVFAAAHGPRLQAIAGEKADGIMTWLMPPGHIAVSRGRLPAGKVINSQVTVLMETDAERARKTARTFFNLWLQLPHYRAAWIEGGFQADDFENGGSDRLIDALFAWGDVDAIAAKVAEYHAAGADCVMLEPLRWNEDTSLHAGIEQHVSPDWNALKPIAERLLAKG